MKEEFINQKAEYIDKDCCNYDWWYVSENKWEYIVSWFQLWAETSFSIWQWVYDEEWNIMWYLWIWLFSNLDYAVKIRIPCNYWKICLPTEHCRVWKKVVSYWQKYFKEHNED